MATSSSRDAVRAASTDPPAADRNAIAAALLGPLFYRRWFSREQIDAEFLEMIIQNAIAGLHRDPRNPEREQAAAKRRP